MNIYWNCDPRRIISNDPIDFTIMKKKPISTIEWGMTIGTSAATLRLQGRCQQLRYRGVECVLDVGHNLEALSRLFTRLPPCAGERRLVLGMMADKPVDAVVRRLADEPLRWYLARPDLPRAADTRRLARALPERIAPRHCASVADALDQAVTDSAAGDQVVIVGSFFTVAEALAVIERETDPGE